jgi:hypothetical protein
VSGMERVAAEAEAQGKPSSHPAPAAVAQPPLTARGLAGSALLRSGAAAGATLMRLQQGAGNRAVGALLQRCGCDGGCGCGTQAYDRHQLAEDERISRAVLQLKANLDGDLPDRAAVRRAADASIARQAGLIQREEDEELPGAGIGLQQPPAAQAGGASAGGGASFNHSSTTVTIDADSAPAFSANITATIGTPHTKITLTPDVQFGFDTGPGGKEIPGTRKITSVGVTVDTEIVKVRFGMGRVNDKHKKAIKEMVALIEAHEAQHRAIIVAEANAAVAKAQKLVGTSKVKEAFKILDEDLDCAAAKAHETLDAKEGLLTAVEQANGDVAITKSASGAKYPCKKAGAKKP